MKLDNIDEVGPLTTNELTMIRRHLSEGQSLVRETVDRLRMSQEENEHLTRRRDELESRIVALETEYEELLGMSLLPNFPASHSHCLFAYPEKTIHDEETSDLDTAESMTELRVCPTYIRSLGRRSHHLH